MCIWMEENEEWWHSHLSFICLHPRMTLGEGITNAAKLIGSRVRRVTCYDPVTGTQLELS